MRYYTKEYYKLLLSLGKVSMYEPVIDKEYSDEEIEELYQKALDKSIEEDRACYDEPPELSFEDDDDPEYLEMLKEELEAYENREPFDEEEAAENFREMYSDNLREPDPDLPDWVRESVDRRILAMYFLPEKTYRKLAAEDEANEKEFEALDEQAEEAREEMLEMIPEEFEEFMDTLEELGSCYMLSADVSDGEIELRIEGWDEEGEDAVYMFRFDGTELLENEGVEVSMHTDEDGDTFSDCELVFSELYFEDGRPEIHMMFDNNGLKYLTFRCDEVYAYRGTIQ